MLMRLCTGAIFFSPMPPRILPVKAATLEVYNQSGREKQCLAEVSLVVYIKSKG